MPIDEGLRMRRSWTPSILSNDTDQTATPVNAYGTKPGNRLWETVDITNVRQNEWFP
jgi:hypothetical protein